MKHFLLILESLFVTVILFINAHLIQISYRPMQTVILKCNISISGRDVKWIHNMTVYWETEAYNKRISSYGRFDIVGDHEMGEYNFRINKTSIVDVGKYTCSWYTTGQSHELMVTEYQLTVNGNPLCMEESKENRRIENDDMVNVVIKVYNPFEHLKVECLNADIQSLTKCSMYNISVERKAFTTQLEDTTLLLMGNNVNLTVDVTMIPETRKLIFKVENIGGSVHCMIDFHGDNLNVTTTGSYIKKEVFTVTTNGSSIKKEGLMEAIITVAVVLLTASTCLVICRRYRRTVANRSSSTIKSHVHVSEYEDAWHSFHCHS